jgi:hypothetical protein
MRMSQIQTVIRELRESQSQEQIAAQVDASQSLSLAGSQVQYLQPLQSQ